MKTPPNLYFTSILALLTGLLLTFVPLAPVSGSEPTNPEPNGSVETPLWTVDLNNYSEICSNGTKDCQFSSPVLTYVDNDGLLDIVVGTNGGYVIAIRNNGQILWTYDVAPIFGMNAGTHNVSSSPAAADIDNDGRIEIIVGVGGVYPGCNGNGGMLVLKHDGTPKQGWPQLSQDFDGDGCTETIFSTPALANLDSDSQLEIIAGGFDKRIYAWNHNGTLVPGFPPPSHLAARFPGWGLGNKLADTVWSSPAITDLNRDGPLDILIGTDEGNFDSRWGDGANGWTCPYESPPPDHMGNPGYCGGSLYGLSASGDELPGFPKYLYEIVQSSPAVADVNADGYPEVFVGMGDFYHRESPDHPTYAFAIHAFDHNGNPLAGWPKQLSGVAIASPAIGNIAGDGKPEIIIATALLSQPYNTQIYAFQANGQLVSGFPMTPRREQGQTDTPLGIGTNPVLGDYDGDGYMEIFLNTSWTTTIVDGNGLQLTAYNFPYNGRPIFYAYGSLLNSPALGDIDNDGQLELIVQNSKLYAFNLPNASDKTDWPMFRRDAQRRGSRPSPASLTVGLDHLAFFQDLEGSQELQGTILLQNTGDDPLEWYGSVWGDNVYAYPDSGTLAPGESVEVTITPYTNQYLEGTYELGSFYLEAYYNNEQVQGSPANVNISLIVGDIQHSYLPLLKGN